MADLQGVSIYTYYIWQVGSAPNDKTLKELSVLSNCGEDCRQAINTYCEMRKMVNMADPDMIPELRNILDRTISIFWHG